MKNTYSEKVIINVALTGIVPTKEQNPHLPVSPEEIVKDAEIVYRLGASMVHIHARDDEGSPSHEKRDCHTAGSQAFAGFVRGKYP